MERDYEYERRLMMQREDFHPVMAFQEELQEDEEEEDLLFKPPEESAEPCMTLANVPQEIEVKGVHFKICYA